MAAELQDLLTELAASNWAPEPARRLADGIEERIVALIPNRLRFALGSDEAAQIARFVAWERCRQLAAEPLAAGASWGYLANKVRWRLADSVRANALRNQRYPLIQDLPEQHDSARRDELGAFVDEIVVELERHGLSIREARRYVLIVAEGPRFERSGIAARLVASGASRAQGDGFAWLLRGGAANPSALARLATGQSPREVFADPLVRRWLRAAAGRDPSFCAGRSGIGRRMSDAMAVEASGPGLARSA